MAQTTTLKATARPREGKGAAREIRREGRVPAVIYGDGKAPETIALEHRDVVMEVKKGHFLSTVFEIDLDGQKTRVIPRDVQLDPVRDFPIHVDLMRIGAHSKVRVGVPVRFINDLLSPGLKRGGVLNVVRHEIEVYAPADNIPSQLTIDLTGLEIGHSIHISAVSLPAGVTPTITNRDFTVATIAGSSAMKPETEEAGPAAAAAEGAAGDAAKAAAGAKAPAGGKAAAPAAAKGGDKK